MESTALTKAFLSVQVTGRARGPDGIVNSVNMTDRFNNYTKLLFYWRKKFRISTTSFQNSSSDRPCANLIYVISIWYTYYRYHRARLFFQCSTFDTGVERSPQIHLIRDRVQNPEHVLCWKRPPNLCLSSSY